MQITSHFVWIELKYELFSDLFVAIYKYFKKNKIESIWNFQNPLSLHITLYYFEENLSELDKSKINKEILKLNLEDNIFIDWFDYFFNSKWNRNVLFIKPKTDLNLKQYNNNFNKIFNRNFIKDNNFNFLPHITFLIIKNKLIFEKHRKNIENIINNELAKIKDINLNNKRCFLYKVNSWFKEEIQIKQFLNNNFFSCQ